MQQQSNDLARRALPLFIRSIARSANVSVEIAGNDAYTQGDRVVLPLVDPTDEHAVSITYAYARHEVAHIRYGEIRSFLDTAAQSSPLRKRIANIFRDVVDEKAYFDDYPGAVQDVDHAYQQLVKRGEFQQITEDSNPSAKMLGHLLYSSRRDVLDQHMFKDLAEGAEFHARNAFSAGAMTKIGGVMARVPAVSSNEDVWQLADEVIRILKDEAENNPPPPSCPESQEGEGVGDGGMMFPGSGDGPSGTTDGKPQTEPTPPPTEAQQQAAQEALSASEGDMGNQDVGQIMAAVLNEASKEAAKEMGRGLGAGDGLADPPGLAVDDPDLIHRVRAASNALRTRLQALVEAAREEEEWNSEAGVDLDDYQLPSVLHGDTAVFLDDDLVKEVDTAVFVVIDRSGSMSNDIDLAREATMAVAHALEQIQDVAVSTAAFPGHLHEVLPLTEFGESVLATSGRYTALHASGGTPMSEAVWYGIDALIKRPESRRIMLVVTDGAPNNTLATQKAIQVAQSCGIEVLGLGIGNTPVEALFPVAKEIQSMDQLSSSMFSMLEDSLVDVVRY